MISVLQFSNSAVRAGIEDHVLMLLQGLDRSRFRPHLVCPPELAAKLGAELPEDVELIPMDFSGTPAVRAMVRLASLLRTRRIDILHSHGFTASMLASPLGWLCRVPVIVETAHGPEAWRRGWKAKCYVDRVVGRFVDHFIAVSKSNADYLMKRKRYPARKITVIQNGCDLSEFTPAASCTSALRATLGIENRDLVLLAPGRLEPQKGHRVLLEAMPRVLAAFPETRLICIGEGSLRADLELQVQTLQLERRIHFVGFRRDVANWFAIADVVVLASLWEGLPLVAVQALAAGRPIVATAVDGTPEVVIDGKTGVTVPPADPAALAEAVCRLLADPARRVALAAAGRRWVETHFSREHMVEQTEQLYLRLWGRLSRKRVASQIVARGASHVCRRLTE